VSGYVRLLQNFVETVPPGETMSKLLSCPAGKKILGGGFVYDGGPLGYVPAIMGSYSTDDMTWRINMKNTTAGFATLSYWIVITCAAAS